MENDSVVSVNKILNPEEDDDAVNKAQTCAAQELPTVEQTSLLDNTNTEE